MSEYVSTRGDGGNKDKGYLDAVLQGLAPDGGLYIPKEYPRVDEAFIRSLLDKSYPELFVAVNSLFIGDEISTDEQIRMAEAAYAPEKFPEAPQGEITPLTWLTDTIAIQQLSLGPTAAFKDMALQPLGQHLNHALDKRGETLRMLGATSGDTGSAAEAAMKGLARVSLTMLSPANRMSEFQRAQMAILSGGNIQNLSVDGVFDDCQDMVKDLKGWPEFADLGAVNSINWGRIAAQVPYYFSGYLQAVHGEVGKEVDFVVPSGNFGNVLAGYIAKKMGLPIGRLIIATNENMVLHTLVQTGNYFKTSEPAEETSSPSMDITKASNVERVLVDVFGSDNPEALRSYMEEFDRTGFASLSNAGVSYDAMKKLGFRSGTSTHADRLDSIEWAHHRNMLIDPHTADAVTVARKASEERRWTDRANIPMVCMSTALPVKFEDTMRQALGFTPERPSRFMGLEERARQLGSAGFATTLKVGDLEGLANWVRRLEVKVS